MAERWEIGGCKVAWQQEDLALRRAVIRKSRTGERRGRQGKGGFWGPHKRQMTEIAALSGLSLSTVARILDGDRLPNITTITRMAIGMGVGVEELVGMLGLSMEEGRKERR